MVICCGHSYFTFGGDELVPAGVAYRLGKAFAAAYVSLSGYVSMVSRNCFGSQLTSCLQSDPFHSIHMCYQGS